MQRHVSSVLGVLFIVIAADLTLSCQRRRSDTETAPVSDTQTSVVGTSGTTSPTVADTPAKLSDGDSHGEAITTTLFRNIARRENPVVVAVTTQSHVNAPDLKQLFGDDDFFSRMFGVAPRSELRRALGSGFIISPDGEILTNNHVVAGAEQIRVALFGDEHKTYMADVLGRDPLTESALIKLKNAPQHLPTAVLGDSDALDPGDWVMAIGNPFQLGHTVTVGVISYKGRPFATTEGRFQNMLQTDASINPGNSGGPLIDLHGQVVGINTAIISGDQGGGNVGIGFAVPINTVKKLLPQLRQGSVQRGELGVQLLTTPITDETAKQLGIPKAEGAIVSRIQPGSPAEHAGLSPGDVVVSYNNTAIRDADHLTSLVVDTPPGTRVPIVFYRGGRQQTVTATLDKLELEKDTASNIEPRGLAPAIGLSLLDLTPDIARQLQLPAGTQGALVEGVEGSTPAANAGIRPGDVILEVNRRPVRSGDDAARQLRSQSGGSIFLLISRRGVQQFIELPRN